MKIKHKDRRPQRAKPAKESDASEEVPFAAKFRDFVEQIAIAIVLALLFRGFEGEAFVIPTGSMAPTLMGMHKDIRCDKCGYEVRTGATEERERQVGPVRKVTCPTCRYVNQIDTLRKNHISFSGDRIVVNKFAYQFSDPKRWDVIVFKFPGNPKQNYIKRLVGLPGETIGVKYGDAYRYDGKQESILRKPPGKIERLLQVVHDSEHIPEELVRAGWPSPWQPAGNGNTWTTAADQGSYQLEPSAETVAWLNYRQLPYAAAWRAMAGGQSLAGVPKRGELITDFCGYNAYHFTREGFSGEGLHWVGDLALECEVNVTSATGELWFDLIEAGRHHTCRIDVSTGAAVLTIDDGEILFDGGGEPVGQLTAQTKIRKPGRYDVRFANVDNELVLWVNGRVVPLQADGASQPGHYSVPAGARPVWTVADPGDLEPVRIGGKGLALDVRQLKVLRDVYYVAADNEKRFMSQNAYDYDGLVDYDKLQRLFTTPRLWATSEIFDLRRDDVRFKLGEDQFFPLGDNSPQSKDARLWYGDQTAHHLKDQIMIDVKPYVERERLIGKAFLVYWPHPWQIKAGVRPIIPNVRRMGRIR